MIRIKPFAALRPKNEYVKECAALPYDVMSSEEARAETQGKPYSFLHIDKAEIDLPEGISLYDERVYRKAAENLKRFEEDGVYVQEKEKKFYFYRQVMDGREQTGIVGCPSIEDYQNGKIKKHELTRADKEEDRVRHVDTCSAQTGPIFLAYKKSEMLDRILDRETSGEPLYDFTSDDGIRHTVWVSSSKSVDEEIEKAFGELDALYIADGHHRAASAVRVGQKRKGLNPLHTGEEEYQYFLSVIFPADSLKIFDYNRLLRDLNGMTGEAFLAAVEKHVGKVTPWTGAGAYRPEKRHVVGLYVEKKWYSVEFYEALCQAEKQAERLDCAILQKYLLAPLLGITDPRTDNRIDFAGGIRGLTYLEERCNEDMAAAISM